MKKFIEDFKKFALKGNVVDMAVGVIVGGAFNKIVTSLVNDVVMPALSVLIGNKNLADMQYVIDASNPDAVVAIKYGMFLQNIVDFLIIALTIFIIVRVMGNLQRKKEEAPKPAPKPSNEEVLLTEIRDLLREKNN
ncbi:MAG: large-conductance mechanosensitive channel protein MscL [Erysipelotrichaceae bacterium]|nr:large-conductance mechanosensitive channel protein MscL [Erysipelotrichaceae bacterium]